MISSKRQLEKTFVEKLDDLKYEHNADIHNRASLEQNFRQHFETFHQHKRGLM